MHRREFLATAAVAAGAAAAAEKPADLPIIDTHQHLWDLKKFKLPWVKDGSPLARDHVTADYLKATAGLNVVKAVYMEVDVAVEQQPAEAEYVLAVCRRLDTPTVAAVISGRPASGGFAKYLEPYRRLDLIKGVRQVLHGEGTPAGFCLGKDFVRGVRLLGDLGKSFDLCMRPGELLDGAKLIDECPGTRFILDHCGNGPVFEKDRSKWQKGMAEVARRPNVVCKVSGILAQCTPGKWTPDDLAPVINHTLEVFGPDRVMFAGDWPVCTLGATFAQWVGALKTIVAGRPAAEQRKLFHDNAERFYGLEEE
jgi:predicted TIM-barrel fold metal-dependent hydrolase